MGSCAAMIGVPIIAASVVATHARAPGDQVFISYEDRDMTGVMCNNMLLSQYSFTLPREPARDCLHITVTRAAAEGGGSVFGGLLHGGDLPVERGLVEAPGLAYKRGFGRHDICGLSA